MVKKLFLIAFIFLSVKLLAQSPVLSNFRMEDAQKNRVYFDSSEPITASTVSGFYLSDGLRHKIIGATVNGSSLTGHYFTVDSPFNYWDTYTIRYEGGSDMADLDSNPLHEFWLTDIINYIPEPKPSGTVYWVRTTGSDSNNGLSHETAFKTLGHAISIEARTIYIEAGIYGSETLRMRYNGTESNPIVIQGYQTQVNGVPVEIEDNYWKWGENGNGTGMNVTLDHTKMPTFVGNNTIRQQQNDSGTFLNVSNYLILKNIQLKWYNRGLQITGNNHVTMKNMNFTYLGKLSNGQGSAIWALGGLEGEQSINNKWNKFININAAQGICLVRLYGGGSLFDNVKVYNDGAERPPDYFLNNYEGSNNTYRNCWVEKIGPSGGGTSNPGAHGFGTKSWGFKQEYSLWQDCTAIFFIGSIEFRHDGTKNNVLRNFKAFDRPGDNDWAGADYKSGGKKYQTNAIVIRDNASGNKVENSTISNIYRGIYFTDQSGEQGYQTGGFNNEFRNTTISNVQYVIGTNDPSNQPNSYGNKFTNLTIHNIYKMYWTNGASWLYESNSITNSSISNIALNSPGRPIVSNNNYYNVGNFPIPSGTSITTLDPQFIDANNGNFYLQSTSPIKDIGKDISGLNYDIEGVERFNGKYSIGAYEDAAPSVGSVSPDVSICLGENITLIASGGTSYSWNTGETTGSITVSPSSTTTYTVTISDGNNSDSHDVIVTVNQPPTVNAGSDVSICSGESTTLTATGVGNFLWSTGETTASITVNPSTTTTYTVTASNSCSTNATDEVLVTVNPGVTLDAGSDVSICSGESTTLTATGNGSFQWSTGETTASITVSPSTTTTYTVTSSNGNCSKTDEVLITVNQPPTVNAGSDVSICSGESTTLAATGVGNFLWNTGETTASITVNPSTTTTYTVTTSNSCSTNATDEVLVTVNPGVTLDAGSDVSICSGESTTLTAAGNGSFQWSTGETTASITVSPSTTTTYTVTSSNGNCSKTDEVLVTVNQPPTVNAGSDRTICEGESTTLTATGVGDFLWSTGETTASITVNPTTTTTYTVTTNSSGCVSTATDDIVVSVNEAPSVTASADISIQNGESTTLTATGTGTFEWSTGETGNSITVNPTTTTTYTVTARTGSNGCTAKDDVIVTVINAQEGGVVTAFAGEDVSICLGKSVILSANGGESYLWSTGETEKTITVTPDETTIYSVKVTSGSNSDTDHVTVYVGGENCLTEVIEKEMLVYPNPTKGLLNIELTGYSEESNISVFNLNGVMIYSENINNTTESLIKKQLNLSRFAKGIYFIRLNNNGKSETKKVLVI